MPASELAQTIQTLPAATNYANPETYVPTMTPRYTAPVQGASGMPPIAIAAGIGAAGTIAGGILQNRGQNRALESQEQANAAAMAYQREQDAKREQAFAAWQANREELLRRYGVDIALGGPAPAQGAAQAPAAPSSAMGRTPMMRGGNVPTGATMGDLMRRRPEGGAWDDWATHGLERA